MKSTQNDTLRKTIIWALNPFEEHPAVQKNTFALLKWLTQRINCRIEPVYVLSPHDFHLPVEVKAEIAEPLQAYAEKLLARALKPVQKLPLIAPTVLIERDPSVSVATRKLAEHVAARGADLVVLGTQAKAGVNRLLMGSFAESFLFLSSAPVLLISPAMKQVESAERMLFPTDCSKQSVDAFHRLCNFIAPLAIHVVIYHAITAPSQGPAQWPDMFKTIFHQSGGASLKEAIEAEAHKCRRQAEQLARYATKRGIETSIVVEESVMKASDAILSQTKKSKAFALAIPTRSGKIKTGLFGSVSREIVRRSPVPVWVFRSK